MSEEREMAMLNEIREMFAMDKSTLAERYKIGVDAVDDYRIAKATAIIDCVIDNLQELIRAKNEKQHYKGFATE